MLKDVRVVAYAPVSDIARARKFYEDKLQISPKDASDDGVLYECGEGSTFYMYVSGGAGTSKASQLFWDVPDVAAEVNALKARGVVFEEYDGPGMKTVNSIAEGPGAKAAWFKDPDGNILAIVQAVR